MNKTKRLICISCLVSGITWGSMIEFNDGELTNSFWSGSMITQTGPTPSFTAQQISSGGTPGTYRQLSHSYGGNGSITTAHLFALAHHDPSSQGAITNVNVSFDLILLNGGSSGAVAYGALLEQNGSFFTAGYELTLIHSWTGVNYTNLTETDYTEVGGISNPDFSATGGPITFGYYASNGTGLSGPTSTLSGLDNFNTTLDVIPEPGSMPFLIYGMTGVIALRRFLRSY